MLTGALVSVASLLGLSFSARFHWWRPRRPGIPILMYHQIGQHRKGSPNNKWRVTTRDFERQLDVLSEKGLRGISLRELLDRPQTGGRVVLTFDDGYAGVLENALPLLQARGFTATVFAVAEKTGKTNDWDTDVPGDALLDASGLRALHAAGIEIGSHGGTHRALPQLADDELLRETRGSKERLEAIVSAPVETFCYPYGAFDDRSAAAVQRAGYRAATVIRSGIPADLSDPYRLRRVPVRGTDPLLDFRIALTRGRSKF